MKTFEDILAIDVNEHKENRKSGNETLSYLSWVWAWSEFKKIYPNAKYEIKTFSDADCVQRPYMYDKNTGYMVMTSVTVDDLTHEMWLPVMDSSNKAMKSEEYSYFVKEYVNKKPTGNMIEKTVAPATMFDVNKAIMRCLTKNLAMFGLGLYIYAGEDLPEKLDKVTESIAFEVSNCKSVDDLTNYYRKNKDCLDDSAIAVFNKLCASRKAEIEANANS